MTTFPVATEVHPAALVTVNVYVVDAVKPGKVPVVVGPVPVIVEPPGDAVTVQAPVDGKPLKATLPVASAQVGWVIVPTVGAAGTVGCTLITTSADAGDVHPPALVTVKLYVDAGSPVRVVLVPLPVCEPGLMVQLPEGNPLKTTLPVASAQVGWV